MHCKGACMKPLLDVLMILDALEKEGSFAAASAKLYKTPSALSYTVHKLESDLNIQLLDRSGHRAKFTRTGKMLLEKGREVLHTVRELEKQAIKLHEGLGKRAGDWRGRHVSFFLCLRLSLKLFINIIA